MEEGLQVSTDFILMIIGKQTVQIELLTQQIQKMKQKEKQEEDKKD